MGHTPVGFGILILPGALGRSGHSSDGRGAWVDLAIFGRVLSCLGFRTLRRITAGGFGDLLLSVVKAAPINCHSTKYSCVAWQLLLALS